MISASHLPLFSGAQNAYSSQLALFGAAKPTSSASGGNLALADRIGQSQMLTKSDKSGLMRLMATVEQFGGGNKEALMQKVAAIATMSEQLNNAKGTAIDPFSAGETLRLYAKAQQSVATDAVHIAPESQIAAMLSHLQAQLS